MIRGTTPALTVKVPADLTGQHCELTLRQAETREHGESRVVLSGDRLTVVPGEKESVLACRLTQEETLSFQAGETVLVQLRWISAEGIASATYTTIMRMLEVQRNGVIVYEA